MFRKILPQDCLNEGAAQNEDIVGDDGNVDEDYLHIVNEVFFDDETEMEEEENFELQGQVFGKSDAEGSYTHSEQEEPALSSSCIGDRITEDHSPNENQDFSEAILNNNDWADVDVEMNEELFIENFGEGMATVDQETLDGEINLMNMYENVEDFVDLRAIVIRKHLTKYFISKEGSVPYQWQKI